MLVGHYAVALIAKRAEPKVSLGTLVLASMSADIIWSACMLFGIEKVAFTVGRGAGHYLKPLNIVFSHSLVMDIVWAALFASAFLFISRCRRCAYIIFIVVISHWFLDVVSHGHDMPIAPGLSETLGFGLWRSIPLTVLVEGGLWTMAIALFVRGDRYLGKARWYGFWIGIAVLTLSWLDNISGPAPKDTTIAAISSLVFFGVSVVWAYWVDRCRAKDTMPLRLTSRQQGSA